MLIKIPFRDSHQRSNHDYCYYSPNNDSSNKRHGLESTKTRVFNFDRRTKSFAQEAAFLIFWYPGLILIRIGFAKTVKNLATFLEPVDCGLVDIDEQFPGV